MSWTATEVRLNVEQEQRPTIQCAPPSLPGAATMPCVAARGIAGDVWAPVAVYSLEYSDTSTGRPCIPPPRPSADERAWWLGVGAAGRESARRTIEAAST